MSSCVCRLALALLVVTACGERPGGLARRDVDGAGGEGGGGSPTADVRISPGSIDFGVPLPGTTSCVPVALVNQGPIDVVPREVLFEGDLAAGIFSADSGALLGELLPADTSGSFTICHTAREVGTRYAGAVVVVMEDGSRAAASIVAGVDAETCVTAVEPARLEFAAGRGERDVQTLTITNLGPFPCWVWSFQAADPWFVLLDPPPVPRAIAPGTAMELAVRYDRDADPGPPTSSTLPYRRVGSDPSPIRLVPREPEICLTVERNPLDFGELRLGATSSRSLVLTNCDVRPLRIGGNDPPRTPAGDVALREGSSPAFRLPDPPTDVTLQPDEAMTIEVRFTPLTVGDHRGTLDVWMHDAAGPISVGVLGIAR